MSRGPCTPAIRKVHDIKSLDEIGPESSAFYVMVPACVDFEHLFVFTLCSSFFVVRTKKNILLQRRYSHPVDKYTGQHPPLPVLPWLLGCNGSVTRRSAQPPIRFWRARCVRRRRDRNGSED